MSQLIFNPLTYDFRSGNKKFFMDIHRVAPVKNVFIFLGVQSLFSEEQFKHLLHQFFRYAHIKNDLNFFINKKINDFFDNIPNDTICIFLMGQSFEARLMNEIRKQVRLPALSKVYWLTYNVYQTSIPTEIRNRTFDRYQDYVDREYTMDNNYFDRHFPRFHRHKNPPIKQHMETPDFFSLSLLLDDLKKAIPGVKYSISCGDPAFVYQWVNSPLLLQRILFPPFEIRLINDSQKIDNLRNPQLINILLKDCKKVEHCYPEWRKMINDCTEENILNKKNGIRNNEKFAIDPELKSNDDPLPALGGRRPARLFTDVENAILSTVQPVATNSFQGNPLVGTIVYGTSTTSTATSGSDFRDQIISSWIERPAPNQ